ncbi:MAG: hypothetical protein WC683_17745 [bacterium]
MIGLFLKDGKDVAAGRKTVVVLPRKEAIVGRAMIMYPISGARQASAIATVLPPQEVDIVGFEAAEACHGISQHVRKALWPTAEKFYLYSLVDVEPFQEPLPLPGEPGGRVRCDLPGIAVLRLVDRHNDPEDPTCLTCLWEEIA